MKRPKIAPAMTEKDVEQAFKETAKQRVKAEKSYEIYKASRRPWSQFNAIDVDGRRLEFGKQTNALRVRDKKLAMDIKQTLGGKPGEADVVVVEVDDVPGQSESGHRYFFGFKGAPWAKYDEFGKRITEDEE